MENKKVKIINIPKKDIERIAKILLPIIISYYEKCKKELDKRIK